MNRKSKNIPWSSKTGNLISQKDPNSFGGPELQLKAKCTLIVFAITSGTDAPLGSTPRLEGSPSCEVDRFEGGRALGAR